VVGGQHLVDVVEQCRDLDERRVNSHSAAGHGLGQEGGDFRHGR
jgi:hypothetical protein